MPSATVPCPRCADPTPPERDRCEHCTGSLRPTGDERSGIGEELLTDVVLSSAIAVPLLLLGGSLLSATTSTPFSAFVPPAVLCFLAGIGAWIAYRECYGRSDAER